MACVSPGTAQGEAGKGFVLLEVAVPPCSTSLRWVRRRTERVIIGMDPHKRSATIEVVDE
jgi:hypothetical protein